jgi:hypothetical protein
MAPGIEEALHAAGINFRFIGVVRSLVTSIPVRRLLLTHAAYRTATKVLRVRQSTNALVFFFFRC